MTKVYEKKNGKLTLVSENEVYKKSELLLLKENGLTANMGIQPGVRQMVQNATKVMNQNPSVTGASTDAGKLDNQVDSESGETTKVTIPTNANASQIANVERMAKSQGMDDAEIEVVRPNDMQSENRLRNAIPFTKEELNELFESMLR